MMGKKIAMCLRGKPDTTLKAGRKYAYRETMGGPTRIYEADPVFVTDVTKAEFNEQFHTDWDKHLSQCGRDKKRLREENEELKHIVEFLRSQTRSFTQMVKDLHSEIDALRRNVND